MNGAFGHALPRGYPPSASIIHPGEGKKKDDERADEAALMKRDPGCPEDRV